MVPFEPQRLVPALDWLADVDEHLDRDSSGGQSRDLSKAHRQCKFH